jgi:hypothetical protein
MSNITIKKKDDALFIDIWNRPGYNYTFSGSIPLAELYPDIFLVSAVVDGVRIMINVQASDEKAALNKFTKHLEENKKMGADISVSKMLK